MLNVEFTLGLLKGFRLENNFLDKHLQLNPITSSGFHLHFPVRYVIQKHSLVHVNTIPLKTSLTEKQTLFQLGSQEQTAVKQHLRATRFFELNKEGFKTAGVRYRQSVQYNRNTNDYFDVVSFVDVVRRGSHRQILLYFCPSFFQFITESHLHGLPPSFLSLLLPNNITPMNEAR